MEVDLKVRKNPTSTWHIFRGWYVYTSGGQKVLMTSTNTKVKGLDGTWHSVKQR